MIETFWVFAVLLVLVGLGALAVTFSLEALVLTGAGLMAAGLVLGVPAGAYYHIKLYRCLAARGRVPDGFLWHPTRYHASLQPAERRLVLPWFVAGGTGFMLILLGCAIFALGFLRV
jgi:hypothetical protein